MAPRSSGDLTEIRVMNDYGAFCLWDDEGGTDAEALGLTAGLAADLGAFAQRWDESIPADVFDDRFDHLPVVRSVVDGLRAVRWRLDHERRRAAETEDDAIRVLGEELAVRVQDELGPGVSREVPARLTAIRC